MIGMLARVILFVPDVRASVAFYRDRLGLAVVAEEAGFVEFDAGGCRLALHKGAAEPGRTKLAFRVEDVAAAREALRATGARVGRLVRGRGFDLCDCHDPDGYCFQLSSRP